MLKRCKIIDGRVAECDNKDAEILLYISPDESEKKHLIEDLKIDEHTLISSLDPDELARLEFEPNHLALIFKRAKNYCHEDDFLFKVTSVGIFLFKEQIIIILPEDIALFEGKQFIKIACIKDVLLRLIYRSIFHYLEHLKVINMISDDLEKKINTAMENKYLHNLFTLEKSLVYYLNAINSNSLLIEKIKLNANKIGFSPEQLEFLDDIIIENTQCYRQAEIYSNILASLMDARVSIVSNNLNVLMKTLNIITISIMVPTLVVSAFSMNVGIPFQHHRFAFWIVMCLSIFSVIGFYLFWKLKKW